jgi:stress response protein YsnF
MKRVGKRQVRDNQRISDDVRHEELRTETTGKVDKETIERAKEKKKTA